MKLYRYEARKYSQCTIGVCGGETYGSTPPILECFEFEVTRETPAGYWVDVWGENKWVSKSSRKRYAHQSKPEALASFVARKNRQIRVLSAQLRDAEYALALATYKKEFGEIAY